LYPIIVAAKVGFKALMAKLFLVCGWSFLVSGNWFHFGICGSAIKCLDDEALQFSQLERSALDSTSVAEASEKLAISHESQETQSTNQPQTTNRKLATRNLSFVAWTFPLIQRIF